MPALTLHPDRLLPADPRTRGVARELYEEVAARPILSPHGHVPARWLSEDVPFPDPTALLITPDHYVTRLLHARGVPLRDLGVGRPPLDEAASRRAFRILCEHWHAFAGTPVRYWLTDELVGIFGVTERPSAATADDVYDRIAARLAEPALRPRALFDTFGIEVLATTDDPCDDLAEHAHLAADPTFRGRVLPTFRPDRYLDPGEATWNERVDRLGETAGIDVGSHAGYLDALADRRRYFVEHGAVSADHGVVDAGTLVLEPSEAARLYDRARAGTLDEAGATAFRRHMLGEMARMSCEDGLVMTVHPGVHRNHHRPTHEAFGADVGADIPTAMEYTRALGPLLEAYGTHPNLRLVLFTIDESTYSRELAPLAGFYPSVYVGAPWWFLDAPAAIRRFRAAVTETVGFTRTSGFIDDTRAFCSIPARHDMARRLDAGYLASLVVEHTLDLDEAHAVIADLVDAQPRAVFGL